MSVAAKLIALAKAEVGYREGRSASGSYNNDQKYSNAVPGLEWSDFQAWCQTFQSWLAMRAGSDSYEPRTASCLTAVNWFRQRGRFSWYPAIGAQVFFGSNGGTHVGRVYKYDADYIWTIEGNTNDNGSAEGNGVYLKRRGRRDSYTYGYGLPAFPEGIVTSDPALRDKPGYTYRASADAPAVSTPKDDEMQTSDNLAVGAWARKRWSTDKGIQDGITVETALSSGYAHSRKAADNTDAILAQLKAQSSTIDKLVDALGAGSAFDAEALKAEIRAAIESVKISISTEA